LSLHGDSWEAFIAQNGFKDTNPIQVDKPVVSGVMVVPPIPFHVMLPTPKPSAYPPIELPDAITKNAEIIKRPARRKPKANSTANAKGKKNARLISRMARNKPKPSVESKPIILSEDYDYDIERFLSNEYPYSQGLCPEPPYDFMTNLPPA
jgi:hypothetical protein